MGHRTKASCDLEFPYTYPTGPTATATANPTAITAAGGGNVPGPVPEHHSVTEMQLAPQKVAIGADQTGAGQGGA